jgi:hypothetical protein
MWVPFADTVVVVTNDPVPSLLRSPDDSVYNDLTLPIKDRSVAARTFSPCCLVFCCGSFFLPFSSEPES